MSILNFIDRIMVKAELMEGMMQKLEVTDALADMPSAAAVMRHATFRCLGCTHASDCASWLEEHESAERAPSYCRNRDLFDFARVGA